MITDEIFQKIIDNSVGDADEAKEEKIDEPEDEQLASDSEELAKPDSWSGGENLEAPQDHLEPVCKELSVKSPESLEDAKPILAKESFGLQVYLSQSDLGTPYLLPESVYRQYIMHVGLGDTSKAKRVVSDHLNDSHAGWVDYEWAVISNN